MEIELRVKGTTGDKLWLYIPIPRIFDGGAVGYNLVDWKTLGQYSGKLDKNGVKIFTGDIVRAIGKDEYDNVNSVSDIIFNRDTAYSVRSRDPDQKPDFYHHGLTLVWGGWESIEVIGNIWENPELLREVS